MEREEPEKEIIDKEYSALNQDEDMKNKQKDLEKSIRNEIISIIVSVFMSCTMFIFCDVFFKLATWNYYSTPVETLKFSMFFSVIVFTLLFAITK